jgi:hypothetical protein
MAMTTNSSISVNPLLILTVLSLLRFHWERCCTLYELRVKPMGPWLPLAQTGAHDVSTRIKLRADVLGGRLFTGPPQSCPERADWRDSVLPISGS